jgi:hypothetical protein
MSKSKNPWGSGDLNDRIVEAEDGHLPVVANLYKMIREILTTVEKIELEYSRKKAAREASDNFRKKREIENE